MRSPMRRRGHDARTSSRGAAALVVLVVLIAGCSAARGSTGGADPAGRTGPSVTGTPVPPTTSAAPPVRLEPSIARGATVPVDSVVSVAASNGTVSTVTMTYRDPAKGEVPVEGTLAADGTRWVANSLLEPGMTYRLAMTGKNPQGDVSSDSASFQTQQLSKKQQIFPTIIGNGATVGIAMPVIVHFDVPVTDRAAFEKRMTVTSTPAQPGSWSWISSNEVHWRPVQYWQPGTKVSVNVDIHGVGAGKGTYGQVSVKGGFTVGQSVVVNADIASLVATVVIDGKAARSIPITGGKAGFETRSGTKVIMEKFQTLRMDANTIGIEPGDPNYYNIPDVHWAMRETYSGEFLHGAPWSVASQGKVNVSHGCIGMSDPNAQWLFSVIKVGDPVVVTGTNRGLEAGNGWTDWNVPFATYKQGSALKA